MTEGGKFQTTTTNSEHYRHWDVHKPVVSFTEMPSFMGSVLFPTNRQEETTSVTRKSFPGAVAKKQEPVKMPDGSIRIEGQTGRNCVLFIPSEFLEASRGDTTIAQCTGAQILPDL